jgi:hypothetical protein
VAAVVDRVVPVDVPAARVAAVVPAVPVRVAAVVDRVVPVDVPAARVAAVVPAAPVRAAAAKIVARVLTAAAAVRPVVDPLRRPVVVADARA